MTPTAAPDAPDVPVPAPPAPRLSIEPVAIADVLRLEHELSISHPVAQALARRGLTVPGEARAWLAADVAHPVSDFAGIDTAVELVLQHIKAGSQITIHGDYDVDGVCSTAILLRTITRLGGHVDWYLPSRTEDGSGLAEHTVERLAARGTALVITADCAITAVDEITLAQKLGMDVLVTDHHTPRVDGALPNVPIVHPGVNGYPCPELCAAGVAYKFAGALLAGAGHDPLDADEDLDLVALATVADVVPLIGENRRLVRAGLKTLAQTSKPGLQALMDIAKVERDHIDSTTLGFRLAPRINASGRLFRADAALELVLTDDAQRAEEIAGELDRMNLERRQTEQDIVRDAEQQAAALGDQAAYVIWGEHWHPGVIGIVAGRIAERFYRPTVVISVDGDHATGSGRSIPGFNLLASLNACAEHLERHGGHAAAAGVQIDPRNLEAFREAFTAHVDEHLTDELRIPRAPVDAVVAGDDLGMPLARELEQLAPFGNGNPGVSLMVPAAQISDVRQMGQGRHIRFNVNAGGTRTSAVMFGCDGRLPCDASGPIDAAFRLEVNEWNGRVEARLVLECAQPSQPQAVRLVGDDPWLDAALAEFTAPLPDNAAGRDISVGAAGVRDRRGRGIAGTVTSLVASGEPVLVVCADAHLRRGHLTGRLGGFDLTSYQALERDRALGVTYTHIVLLDPPLDNAPTIPAGPLVHLSWGPDEITFAAAIAAREDLRSAAAAIYRALRARPSADDDSLEAALRDGQRTPALAGRALRVLTELGLLSVEGRSVTVVPDAARTDLERSPTFRHFTASTAAA